MECVMINLVLCGTINCAFLPGMFRIQPDRCDELINYDRVAYQLTVMLFHICLYKHVNILKTNTSGD